VRVLNDGKVGIGVTSVPPTVRMDILGEVRMVRNLHIGSSLGQNYNSSSHRGLTIDNGINFGWRFLTFSNTNGTILTLNGAGEKTLFGPERPYFLISNTIGTSLKLITENNPQFGNEAIIEFRENFRLKYSNERRYQFRVNSSIGTTYFEKFISNTAPCGGPIQWHSVSINPYLCQSSSQGLVKVGHIGSTTGAMMLMYDGWFLNDGYAGNFLSLSDESFKEDIEQITPQDAVDIIKDLRGVSFYWKERTSNDTMVALDNRYLQRRKSYGFISQEVEGVIPEIVDDMGDKKFMNYDAIIPFLVEAFKHQQEQIEDLNQRLLNCCGEMLGDSGSIEMLNNGNGNSLNQLGDKTNDNLMLKAILYQNTPNPFFQQTEIKYFIPKEARQADLYIYNMMGNQISQYRITARENGNHVIYGSELTPGMYIYTLIVDGKEVDSKKMILTN
ncbi:MAG: tail fiber domain-containing protein, partial [Bacteroidetes bacterium]|nr:tail fiber domain-containing protein [Bacteroidota bacterium]